MGQTEFNFAQLPSTTAKTTNTLSQFVAGGVDTIPVSNGTNFVYSYPQNQNTALIMRQLMGSPIIAETMSFLDTATSTALTDGMAYFQAIYIPFPMLVSGALLWLSTAGVFTGDNENAIGLYSFSAGTLAQIAKTVNDQNNWKTLGYSQRAFVTPITVSRGLYFIGWLYNSSAQTTAPALRALTGANSVYPVLGETNTAAFARSNSGQTALPTTQTFVAMNTAPGVLYYMGLY